MISPDGDAVLAERAADLGRLVAQSPEYQALQRAGTRVNADPSLRALLERLETLQRAVEALAERGEEPSTEQREELERLMEQVQAGPAYQGLVAAQANFDKLMYRVNRHVAEGMRRGAASPIITLS